MRRKARARLLSSKPMTREKKHGWLRRMVWLVVGCAIVAALVVAGTNAATIVTTKDAIVDTETAAAFGADAIVVRGASVFADGTPSGILQDRLDDGIELYRAGAAPKIIMSGDNGTESYNEVLAMKNYAISKGVPSEDIFCDHAGFSTYESMYRARDIFRAEKIVIVSQEYHLARSVYLAKALGLDAYGVAADDRAYYGRWKMDVREALARSKDFFSAVIQPEPTYLGEAIPVSGNGDLTNDK